MKSPQDELNSLKLLQFNLTKLLALLNRSDVFNSNTIVKKNTTELLSLTNLYTQRFEKGEPKTCQAYVESMNPPYSSVSEVFGLSRLLDMHSFEEVTTYIFQAIISCLGHETSKVTFFPKNGDLYLGAIAQHLGDMFIQQQQYRYERHNAIRPQQLAEYYFASGNYAAAMNVILYQRFEPHKDEAIADIEFFLLANIMRVSSCHLAINNIQQPYSYEEINDAESITLRFKDELGFNFRDLKVALFVEYFLQKYESFEKIFHELKSEALLTAVKVALPSSDANKELGCIQQFKNVLRELYGSKNFRLGIDQVLHINETEAIKRLPHKLTGFLNDHGVRTLFTAKVFKLFEQLTSLPISDKSDAKGLTKEDHAEVCSFKEKFTHVINEANTPVSIDSITQRLNLLKTT